MQKTLLSIIVAFAVFCAGAQGRTDSLRTDPAVLRSLPADSVQIAKKPPLHFDSLFYANHLFVKFQNPVRRLQPKKDWQGKELLFYLSIGLFLMFAFIKNSFGKYLQDLVRIFLRTTLKQRQVKEQLMQAPLPSLLLNVLFLFSGALFICLLLQRYGLANRFPFWALWLYGAAGLALMYFIKFVTLKFCGWLFRVSDATNTYVFIVFTTNKIIGIGLLPFIALISFTTGVLNQVFFTLALMLLGGLFLYRYYFSYISVRKQIRMHPFHFLLYLLALEIAPLLLINKLLVEFVL